MKVRIQLLRVLSAVTVDLVSFHMAVHSAVRSLGDGAQ